MGCGGGFQFDGWSSIGGCHGEGGDTAIGAGLDDESVEWHVGILLGGQSGTADILVVADKPCIEAWNGWEMGGCPSTEAFGNGLHEIEFGIGLPDTLEPSPAGEAGPIVGRGLLAGFGGADEVGCGEANLCRGRQAGQ